MSRIRSKNTFPEKVVRSLIHRNGYRFRLHGKDLPGTPDIVLPKYKTVVFVHGCFWHQHEKCKKASVPKTNSNYWIPKLKKNVERFDKIQIELKMTGWKVLVIWECEINNSKKILRRLDSKIRKKR